MERFFGTPAVFNGSKILIWKQITTRTPTIFPITCCIQWFKDTNLKANHNSYYTDKVHSTAVFNGSKILIWKQITTCVYFCLLCVRCIQWFKDTNLKANHNRQAEALQKWKAVFNGSKILIWKQITTVLTFIIRPAQLYSMVQRY